MKHRFIVSLVVLVLAFTGQSIVNAYPPGLYEDGFVLERIQPNGTTHIEVEFTFSEFREIEREFTYQSGKYQVIADDNDWWYYAVLDTEGEYEPSALKVGIDAPNGINPGLRRSSARMDEIEDEWDAEILTREEFNEWFIEGIEDAIVSEEVLEINVAIVCVEFEWDDNYPPDVRGGYPSSYQLHRDDNNGDLPALTGEQVRLIYDSLDEYYTSEDEDMRPPEPEADTGKVYGSCRDYYAEVFND